MWVISGVQASTSALLLHNECTVVYAGHDIGSNFESMFSELVIGNSWASLASAGSWNDDDMLEVSPV